MEVTVVVKNGTNEHFFTEAEWEVYKKHAVKEAFEADWTAAIEASLTEDAEQIVFDSISAKAEESYQTNQQRVLDILTAEKKPLSTKEIMALAKIQNARRAQEALAKLINRGFVHRIRKVRTEGGFYYLYSVAKQNSKMTAEDIRDLLFANGPQGVASFSEMLTGTGKEGVQEALAEAIRTKQVVLRNRVFMLPIGR